MSVFLPQGREDRDRSYLYCRACKIPSTPPTCPHCGAPMAIRKGSRHPYRGHKFFWCQCQVKTRPPEVTWGPGAPGRIHSHYKTDNWQTYHQPGTRPPFGGWDKEGK